MVSLHGNPIAQGDAEEQRMQTVVLAPELVSGGVCVDTGSKILQQITPVLLHKQKWDAIAHKLKTFQQSLLKKKKT